MANERDETTRFEREWWGSCANSFGEEQKQFVYAKHMGLDVYKEIIPERKQGYQFNLQGKSIIDIGGGPSSLLLKCVNYGRAVVVDPAEFPEWVKARYASLKIELDNRPAEEIDYKGFDEVWIYNVLQHVIDPEKLLQNALKAGRIVRILDWIGGGVPGHPHNITKILLDKYFHEGKMVQLNDDGCFGEAYCGVETNWEGPGHPGDPGPTGIEGPTGIVYSGPAKKKTFHLLGLAHLATNKNEAIACAFSQKVLKLGTMLKRSGHKVYFYGVEGSTVDCDEFIPVSTKQVLKDTYGDYDYKSIQYKHDQNDNAYKTFNLNAIREINKRKKNDDFLLITFGWGQKAIADAVQLPLTIESGIGYPSTFANYRVYESYAIMHYHYGKDGVEDGHFYDCVIPNYFDPNDFEYKENKQDYFLYLGRLIKRKGIQIAKETVEAIGGKLVVAGQRRENAPEDAIDTSAPFIQYVGFADLTKRRELLANAKALFVPTTYIGPFEGVSIEAAFSGTPTITTDHGCFAENVLHARTGYRCRTLEQFTWAAKNIGNIRPQDCRVWAMSNFTLDRVAKMYDEFFHQVYGLMNKGWYEPNTSRTELDWLKREYV